MPKNIYIISGLGADERVFQRIDFSGYPVNYVQWILPLDDESIENYASRLLVQITTPKPIIIGLSFGGLIAIEIAKQIETEKIILISSAKTKSQIPFYYRWAGKLKLHKLLPVHLLKKFNPITNWFFGASSDFDKQLLKQILIDTDPGFLKWAIDKIVNWENTVIPLSITHIHGTADHILPLRFVTYDISIIDGGHLMTLNEAEEVTEMIWNCL